MSGIEESVSHVISSCGGMTDDRTRIFTEFRQLCNSTKNQISFDETSKCENNLTQCIIDPTILNLPNRVHTVNNWENVMRTWLNDHIQDFGQDYVKQYVSISYYYFLS